ncbi:MAG: hypothetical protein K2X82_07705, partial [Gemmataceae bacterium]|nr:hypothetical protein [Gemmataceae bacterium]
PDAAWHADAARVAVLPVGLYEHPLTTGTTIGAAAVENGRRMGTALVAHGLWRQKAGDPGAFVADLRTALALGRNLRNGSITAALRHGQAVARTALFGTDQWLRNLDGRPDLVRAAAAEVWEDDRAVLTRWAPGRGVVPPAAAGPGEEVPFDPTPHLLAERYVVREKLKAPGQWLPDDLTPAGRNRDLEVPVADLAGFGWATPWERERTRRLVESPDRGRTPGYARLVRGRPGARFLLDAPNPDQLAEQDRDLRALRRAVLLHLAVRLYQADHAGAPPPDLAALAPTYLPAVPDDPYGDGAFRYRVVRLAEVPAARRPSWAFAAGRPVVWSVGPDRADGGGWDEAVGPGDRLRTRDLVYPLPLPAPQPPGAGG